MKQLIRKAVFETNSSSSHSISLATADKEFVMDTIYPDQDGRIVLVGGEFGWDWFKHNDALTKANYAAQDIVDKSLLIDVIKEQTGALEVIITANDNDGYIDHDSVGTTPNDREELRNFIFNKNSWLFGGNDNGYPDPTFYDVPEIRDGKMIVPKYKYELTVEGLEKSTKFKEYPSDEEIEHGLSSLLSYGTLLSDSGHFIDDSSIMWQIIRPRDYYELSWRVQQDYKSGELIFTKEGGAMYKIENELDEDSSYKKLPWDEKQKALTERVLNTPGVFKKVKFTLAEI